MSHPTFPLVVHVITNLDSGGAEAVLYRLCNNDKAYRHSVVSLMNLGTYGSMLQGAGINVLSLNMKQHQISLTGILALWRFLRVNRPYVVQTWMYHSDLIGGVIARLVGIRRVFWNIRHTKLEKEQSKFLTRVISVICANLSRFVPYRIICCAKKSADVHISLGYNKKKIVVIQNGYDLNQFKINYESRNKIRAELYIENNLPLLGMVGRFDSYKDHNNLISSLFILKSKGIVFKCCLIGTDMNFYNKKIVGMINKYNLEDCFLLLNQRNDISDIMNALDIHVLSSIGEAFPNVLAEAMACGTPCVTTDVGDAALIVGETGWVVPPKDPDALASALSEAITMLSDPALWEERQKACRVRIENNFSIEKMVRSYNEVWAS